MEVHILRQYVGMISLESVWENFKKYGSVEQEQNVRLRGRHSELYLQVKEIFMLSF